MSQAPKRRKLSLKKAAGQNTTKSKIQEPCNTIVSMFKRQKNRQITLEHKEEKESGSEGDVVITNVIGLNTGGEQSISNSTPGAETVSDRCHSKQVDRIRKKLSLSNKKRPKVRENHVSASDSDFDSDSLPGQKRRTSHHKPTRSLSEQGSNSQRTPYRLRKRKTIPILDVSDLETDGEEELDKSEINRTKCAEFKNHESGNDNEDIKFVDNQSTESSENDDVIVEDKNRYFSDSNKKKLSSPLKKRGLSLKKTKSGGENLKEHVESQDKETVSHFPEDLKSEKGIEKDICNVVANTVKSNHVEVSEEANLHKEKAVGVEKPNRSNVSRSEKGVNNVNSVLMQKRDSSVDITMSDKKTKNNKNKSNVDKNTAGRKKPMAAYKGSSKNDGKAMDTLNNTVEDALVIDDTEHDEVGNINASTKETGVIANAKEDTDNDDGDDDNDRSDTPEFRVPYYLENFKTVIKSVLDDEENARLFDDVDMKYIRIFNQLEESCQKLYVRLFCRKLSWLLVTKVNYPEIGNNIPELIDTLINVGLLHSGDGLADLSIVLKILSGPDLKGLAKSFHINCQAMTKPKIIEELMKKSRHSSISSMFKGGITGTMEKTILRRAKSYLGKVCRLQEEPRAIFIRILMLFSLYNTNFDEESGGGGQNQLFQMLMVNIGRVVYPTYTVNKNRSVFQDRAALVRFETALQFEMNIQGMTEKGKWTQAYDLYKQAKETGTPVLKDEIYLEWDGRLPQFLRLYTAGSVYTRIDNMGVEILQRLRLYKEAVHLLEDLLSQDLYCVHYRGHWYERLAINLEAHLKSVGKSLNVIQRGLLDPRVRTGRRLALYERARKICEAPKSKYSERICEFEHQEVLATPEVYVEGMVISDAMSVGMKYQFVMQGDSDSVTFCAVEELVLEHYKQNGYPEGLHAEGSIVSNLFVLLFWDIMFMEVENVFHGPFQSCPLDIATPEFYINRQQCVDDRLNWLRQASVEELSAEVGRIWNEHVGKMCAGMNWEKFSGPETHQNLISCMEGPVIAGILERYVKDPRHTRSGFPDLTLWNTDTKQFKICEVKGPNDKLSYKQILWIDYLLKLGVDAEVCYVKAVGSKKLKPVMKN